MAVDETAPNTPPLDEVHQEAADITHRQFDNRWATHSEMAQLSREQRETAKTAAVAMAEKFDLSPEDFALVETQIPGGESRPAVVYAAVSGIYKGSWNEIMGDETNKDFIVEINDQEVDTRRGMTDRLYEAMVQQAHDRGDDLPDSKQAADKLRQPWTQTWRTGQADIADDHFAPRALTYGNGRIVWDGAKADIADRDIRFRPVVVLE